MSRETSPRTASARKTAGYDAAFAAATLAAASGAIGESDESVTESLSSIAGAVIGLTASAHALPPGGEEVIGCVCEAAGDVLSAKGRRDRRRAVEALQVAVGALTGFLAHECALSHSGIGRA